MPWPRFRLQYLALHCHPVLWYSLRVLLKHRISHQLSLNRAFSFLWKHRWHIPRLFDKMLFALKNSFWFLIWVLSKTRLWTRLIGCKQRPFYPQTSCYFFCSFVSSFAKDNWVRWQCHAHNMYQWTSERGNRSRTRCGMDLSKQTMHSCMHLSKLSQTKRMLSVMQKREVETAREGKARAWEVTVSFTA